MVENSVFFERSYHSMKISHKKPKENNVFFLPLLSIMFEIWILLFYTSRYAEVHEAFFILTHMRILPSVFICRSIECILAARNEEKIVNLKTNGRDES